MTKKLTSDPVSTKAQVREAYASIAQRFSQSGRASCCGPDNSQTISVDEIYALGDRATLPESVTGLALGCGNPVALTDLQPGEVILDLGSGGGIDVFLAAQRVGPAGRAIGVDMTAEMIDLARRNARQVGAENVEFRLGEIEALPMPDASVDVIISNCVINLSPDKDAVFAEAYRVLKPGGRVTISDIVTQGPLPDAIRESVQAWAGCIAGALEERDYLEKIRGAGFERVEVIARESARVSDLAGSPDFAPTQGRDCAALVGNLDPETLAPHADTAISSITVRAYKPRR